MSGPDVPPRQLTAVGIGPQKTASSWLHACLAEHPDVCLPHEVKETFFFDRRFDSGWDWYWSHFQCAAQQAVCEIAPTYFDSDAARARIAEHNPECRLLVTLRNPVDRAFSAYLHLRRKDGLTIPFEQAIREHPTILSGSRYAEHLPKWIDTFGRDRVLLLLQEDIQSRPEAVLSSVYAFLGIAAVPLPQIAREQVNVRSLPAHPRFARAASQLARWLRGRRFHKVIEVVKPWATSLVYSGHHGDFPVMQKATARELYQSFAPDVRYIEDLAGRELKAWRAEEPVS